MNTSSPILLVGIGTSGSRIARNVARAFGENIRLTLADTDAKTGEDAESFTLLGGNRLAGQGAGGNAINARMAASDSLSSFDPLLEGVRLAVFVTCLGGGTGSGATVEVVNHFASRGIPSIVFATIPFLFEGDDRQRAARGALPLIEGAANATFVVPLDKLVSDADTLDNALKRATDTLASGVTLLWRLIEKPGYIQLSSAQIRQLIQNAGRGRFATATAQGLNRAQDVVDQLVRSELLATAQAPVKSVLCGILAGEDLRLSELSQISKGLQKAFGEQLDFHLGTVNDESVFSGRLSVVVMLFEQSERKATDTAKDAPAKHPLSPVAQGRFTHSEQMEWHGENLDIPTYLRKNISLEY